MENGYGLDLIDKTLLQLAREYTLPALFLWYQGFPAHNSHSPLKHTLKLALAESAGIPKGVIDEVLEGVESVRELIQIGKNYQIP